MKVPSADPLRTTVLWLSAHARFPASRLPAGAEALLCVAALAAAPGAEAERPRLLPSRREGPKEAALRAHGERRSQAHFKSDNSAKV
mgnify:CR=1 FL=1